jgi:hypothetical protein
MTNPLIEKYNELYNVKTGLAQVASMSMERDIMSGTFHFTLKVTDVMNQDYYYASSAPTLDGVMNCIKIFLKNHTKT